jgi:LacI family transcriptional regulator
VLGTEHLLELGHRRIAFVGGRADLESSRLREQGFREAMAAAGVPVDEVLVRAGDYRKEPTREPVHDLLTLADRPTAVFAANDLSAIATIEVARELGLRVPDDVSVIGFDDIPESAQTEPPLTTVHQPIQQMGAEAIGLLTALLDGDEVPEPHVRLPTSLVRRGSTAPAPARR